MEGKRGIMVYDDGDEARALAIALSRQTGADVVICYIARPVQDITQTLAEMPANWVRPTAPPPAAVAADVKIKGKSEAYYARRAQIARGGKR